MTSRGAVRTITTLILLSCFSGVVLANDAGTGGDAGNSTSTAAWLPATNSTYYGNLTISSDNDDYYAINMSNATGIAVELTYNSTEDFDLYLFDQNGSYIDTSHEGWLKAHDISAWSFTRLAREAASRMGPGSSMITLSYLGSQRAMRGYNVMGVAKASLEASMRYLAMDLGERDIRVNAISAGPIQTLAARGISGFSDIFDEVEKRAALGRGVTTEEVGNAATFLLSPLASGITGEVIYVDGGFRMMG
jgi:NAD(P)-dependent dehydrogenase (short-subunit alcohol dehydrogenase family)